MESNKKLTIGLSFSLMSLAGGVFIWLASMAVFGKPAWDGLLTAYIYTAGITQGALAIAVIMRIISVRWSAPLYRLAATIAVSFLPVGFVMILAIIFSGGSIFYWYGQGAESFWYNYPFFAFRHLAIFAIVYTIVIRLYIISTETNRQTEKSVPAINNNLLVTGFFYLLSVVAYQTLISWDFAMMLNKHFADTVWSVLFMMTSLYGGIALLTLIMFASKQFLNVKTFSNEHLQNMAKLLLTFSIIRVFYWYTQFFDIWYVNFPEETKPIFTVMFGKYMPFFLIVFILLTLIPFFSLLFKRIRETNIALAGISLAVLAGVWLERYLLIMPPLHEQQKVAESLFFNPVSFVFTFGIIGGVFSRLISLVKKNEHIFPDEKAMAIDPLYIDPKGWQ